MDYACVTHRSTADHPEEAGKPCHWVLLDMLIGVRMTFELDCRVCRDIQAPHHDILGLALADRDSHLESHRSGGYG